MSCFLCRKRRHLAPAEKWWKLNRHCPTTIGYDTIAAVDGAEGVHLFHERLNEIDLVLLDFAMPKMNGVEAFGELIQIKPDVKVILSSGYAEEVVLQRFPGPQPAGILHQPYKLDTLKAELERLLGNDG